MRIAPRHVLASIAAAAMATSAHSALVYSLASDGTSLILFDSSTPGAVTVIGALSGAVTTLDGLDFRQADGNLYGYQAASSGIYRVDLGSGATTLVSTSNAPVTTTLMGIDFNPVVDRLRVVSVNDENRRINVANGVALSDGALNYAVGDVNAGVSPNVRDAAYTNSDRNPATGTTLFYIDHVLNTLVSTTSPNAGTLNTVGALGVDTDEFLGFDIFTDLNGLNTAYASLRVSGVDGLYTINLATGAASLIGAIGANRLDGLAVQVVPEPASLALFGIAGLAAFGVRQRSTAVAIKR